MTEVAGARFAFSDESVVIQVYYDDVTGHPTRVTASNTGSASEVTYTVASGDRTFSGTRTVPAGSEDYSIPTGLASRVNFLTNDCYLAATHAA
jgi:hypothetical protein